MSSVEQNSTQCFLISISQKVFRMVNPLLDFELDKPSIRYVGSGYSAPSASSLSLTEPCGRLMLAAVLQSSLPMASSRS